MYGASPIAQLLKNAPAIQETQETLVRSLVGEGPLKEEMTWIYIFPTHSVEETILSPLCILGTLIEDE